MSLRTHTPPPIEFTVQNFKDGRAITYRLQGGQYFHRLAGEPVFTPSGAAHYAGAAAHARRVHRVSDPFASLAA